MSLLSILVALLFLSFLIFVHELAHFLVGKAVGIHAEVFSIGFGTPLFRFRRGQTEYRISMIPAGGYVKFPGEYAEEESRLEGTFHQAPVWKRTLVVAAGPLSNLALGFLIFWMLAMIGVPEKTMPPIGEVFQPSTEGITYWDDPTAAFPAKKAGIQPGDRVLAINGRRLDSWSEFTQEVMIHPNEPVELLIERNGQRRTVVVTPRPVLRGKMVIGQIGVAPQQEMFLVETLPDGSERRRQIARVDGLPAYGPTLFLEIPAGATVQLSLDDGSQQTVQVERWIGTSDGGRVLRVDGEPIPDLQTLRRRLIGRNLPESIRIRWETPTGDQQERAVSPELDVRVVGTAQQLPYPFVPALNDRLIAVSEIPVREYARVREELETAASTGRRVLLTFERERRVLFYRWREVHHLEAPVRRRDGHYQIPGIQLRTNFAAGRGALTLGPLQLVDQMRLLDPTTGRSLQIELRGTPIRRYGPLAAVAQGVAMTQDTVDQMLSLLRRLVVGEVSLKYISGPVGIVNITQKTLVRGGWSWASLLSVLSLTAFISINLAIVNLLPIPIADGGQLLFFGLEAIRGRPLDARWQVLIQQISVLVLIGLFALVTLKDLVYW